jgi:hypothetical protein
MSGSISMSRASSPLAEARRERLDTSTLRATKLKRRGNNERTNMVNCLIHRYYESGNVWSRAECRARHA